VNQKRWRKVERGTPYLSKKIPKDWVQTRNDLFETGIESPRREDVVSFFEEEMRRNKKYGKKN